MSGQSSRRTRARANAGGVAELLQNLSNDRWLSRHPYARSLEAQNGGNGLTLLRTAALQAVDRLAKLGPAGTRYRTIATRCDLHGELHKVVAGELTLSRRQLYRDLARARSAIGDEIRAALLQPAHSIPIGAGDHGARFETAVSLSAGGHGTAAVEHFTPVVAALSGDGAVWGRCVLAGLLLDNGEVTSARHQLNTASARCEDPDGPGMAYVLLTKAKLLHQIGLAKEASALLEPIVPRAQANAEAGSALAVEARSEILTLLAFLYHERGNFAEAAATNAKNPAACTDARVSFAARRQYLNVNAMLACDGAGGLEPARQASSAFYRFAIAHGFIDDVSAALLQMSGIARFQRCLDEAERLARQSLSIQRAIQASGAPVLGMLTAVAVDKAEYPEAIRLARETRNRATAGSHTWWVAHLHEAEALARTGRHVKARAICRRVARDGDNRDARVASCLRRVEATIFATLGQQRKACTAAGLSLELLGSHAPPFHRLKTLLVAQEIRPNRGRQAEIRDLAGVLGWRKLYTGAD